MADGVAITAGSGTTILTDETASGHAQVVKLAISTDGSATLIPAEATNGLDVDVTRVQGTVTVAVANVENATLADNAGFTDGATRVMVAGYVYDETAGTALTENDAAAARINANRAVVGTIEDGVTRGRYATVFPTGALRVDGSNTNQPVTVGNTVVVEGTVAHDGIDANAPVKVGMRAIAHGTNPTAVAAADRTDWLANRAGVPWVIGGHPNVVTLKHTTITTAVTDAAIITVSAGTKIVVTAFTVTLDNASTVFPTFLMGFGTANTPTTTGVIGAHGGIPAGGGFSRGDGSGIIGIGDDGEDLRVTTTGNATGNGLQIVVTYYTIES